MTTERIAPDLALRGRRWLGVVQRVNKHLMVPTIRSGGVTVAGDNDIAASCGLEVVRGPTGRRKIEMSVERLGRLGERNRDSRFYELVQDTIDALSEGARPARVIEVVLDDGRTTYAHDLPSRAAQVAMAQLIGPHLDRQLSRTSFAYRPGIAREHAAFAAHRLVTAGYRYGMKADVRKFFDNIHPHQIANAVTDLLPSAAETTIEFLIATTRAPVWRRPTSREVRDGIAPLKGPAKNTILQGSVLGPMLSNAVGEVVFDRPFKAVMGEAAVLLRWSDDGFVFGRSPDATVEGLGVLRELAAAAGFELHRKKTDTVVRDLAVEPVLWVGKMISAAGVRTSVDEIDAAIARIALADPYLPEHRGRFTQLAHALMLDSWNAVGDVAVQIHEHCGEERWLALDVAMYELKRRTRSKRFGKFESIAAKVLLETRP